MITTLAAPHAVLAAAGQDGTDMTVVFDAEQNSEANSALLAGTSLHYVGSVPAVTAATCSPCPRPPGGSSMRTGSAS